MVIYPLDKYGLHFIKLCPSQNNTFTLNLSYTD